MFPVLQIGPLALQTPGLLVIIGIWMGLSVSERLASRFDIESNQLYNLVMVGLLAGIVGARLAYAIQYSSIFTANPLNIFSLTLTMFNSEAGLVIGTLAGLIYAQKKSLSLKTTLDALTPGVSVFMIFYHLANFASGDAFGSIVKMPIAIELWGQTRHPVQLYEMAAAVVIAVTLILRIQRKKKAPDNFLNTYLPGTFFWTYLALTALARLFFEYFRGDSTTLPGNIHVAQVIAWLILAVSLWQLHKQILLNQNLPSAPAKDVDHVA